MFKKMFPYLWKAIRRRKAEKDLTNILRDIVNMYHTTDNRYFLANYPDGETKIVHF